MEERIDNSQELQPRKKVWIWVVSIIIIAAIIVGVFYLMKSKSRTDKQTVGELEPVNEEYSNNKKAADPNQYNWSTMSQGPYRDRISFATGKSLTSWTNSGKILAEHASVPEVIVKDGTIYAYFVDVSEDGKAEQIGMISSSDKGSTWSSKQVINISGLGDKVAVDPDPYLLSDGRIRLYYFDISKTKIEGTKNNTIYSALSDDGVNFIEEQGSRFKYADIFDPEVIFDGKTWRMYVGTSDQKVLSATSSDGLSFTYEGVALTGGAIPNVVLENGTYYMFTGGIDISTSKDGKTFSKTSNRFDSGRLTADPGVVKLGENNYFMIYKTNEGKALK